MAERGDVLQVKRRLGFGSEDSGERVVVVQATRLNSVLPTTIVVPLDSAQAPHAESLTVPVSAREAGSDQPLLALASALHVALLDRLAPGRVGRLDARTLLKLDQKVRLILDL
jgi:mRNA-degrading endonuclease toxin of MazEF toxin-antitoxin module